jgi:sterol carrier protein 2
MQKSNNRVFIIGVGMTKFLKPRDNNPDYPDLAKQATLRALRDAGIPYSKIEQAAVGYAYGDTTCGQRALYQVGITGIPILNVNNACATGSTALYYAYSVIKSGQSDCTLALGFEKMSPGSLQTYFADRANPFGPLFEKLEKVRPNSPNGPFAPKIFGSAGLEYKEKYGAKDSHFAKIAYKNHLHSVNNPYSQFRDKYTLDQIEKSQKIFGPLTKLQCCPTSDGAGCAILCSEQFLKEHGLEDQAVEVVGMLLRTDPSSTYTDNSAMKVAGYDMSKTTADLLYKQTGISPQDAQVVELHDCFSANELITYEAIGLCPEGKAPEYIDKDQFTYGGKYVVNPSGGLISKGHPLGATGLAQCSELIWQLRGMAEKRQVSNCKIALQHNIGLGGACVMAIYKKYNSNKGYTREDQTSDPDKLEQFEKKQNVAATPISSDDKKSMIIPTKQQIRPKL